jgi:hypothetical protein
MKYLAFSQTKLGSSLSLPAHGKGGARATSFLAAHFAKRNTKFGGGGTPEAIPLLRDATGQEARAGKNSFPPTSFLFARPSENYQKSASGFSLKKVRILFRTVSQFVKFAFPASLGASPLASANEFSSNFQNEPIFFSPEGRTQSGNFLPKSDYKLKHKTI